MTNILFFVIHQAGALNACWKLANDLREGGHCVRFAGLPDSEQDFARRNFDYDIVFRDFFPPGSLVQYDYYSHSRLQWLRDVFDAPRQYFAFREFLRYLTSGADAEFFSLLEEKSVEFVVFVGVPYVEWMAVLAIAKRVKAVYLRADFSVPPSSGSPPCDSDLIPRLEGSMRQTLRIRLGWARIGLSRLFAMTGARRLTMKLARHYGVSRAFVPTTYQLEATVPLAELIPFHPDFEFSPLPLPHRHYIGPCVDLDPQARSFDWASINSDKKIAYCSLGTYVWRSKTTYRRYFESVMTAARHMPDWHWIVTLGRAISLTDLIDPPENVTIVESAPQIDILKRANVAITHGGANSVKECILLGVPMLLLPLAGDQHGVAARAVHHGLGLREKIETLTPRDLVHLVRSLDANPFIQCQLRLMQMRFQQMDDLKIGCRLIESLLPTSGYTPDRVREPIDEIASTD